MKFKVSILLLTFKTAILLYYYLIPSILDSDIPPCDELHSCQACLTNTTCGWCTSNSKCIEGDSFGPFSKLCERYSYQTCPSLFFFVFAYILTSLCWIFLIASIFLTCPLLSPFYYLLFLLPFSSLLC